MELLNAYLYCWRECNSIDIIIVTAATKTSSFLVQTDRNSQKHLHHRYGLQLIAIAHLQSNLKLHYPPHHSLPLPTSILLNTKACSQSHPGALPCYFDSHFPDFSDPNSCHFSTTNCPNWEVLLRCQQLLQGFHHRATYLPWAALGNRPLPVQIDRGDLVWSGKSGLPGNQSRICLL